MSAEAEAEGAAELAALPDKVISAILLRLPPKPLLRCPAVCKAWRRLGSDRALLLEHRLRQPSQPLLRVHRSVGDDVESLLLALLHYCLEAVDLRRTCGEPPRTVVRFKDTEYMDLRVDRGAFEALDVHGSCDGLLLLSYLDAFFVCNPATRRWAPLPPLRARDIAGFYAHAASGEYQVLYQRHNVGQRKYYVLTVGSQQARTIGRPASSASVGEALSRRLWPAGAMPPVLLHGSLHWPPHWLQQNNILVFDTAAEVFRWMRPPAIRNSNFLFETEGRLALSCWEQKEWRADLWIMQDYKNEGWVHKYQIELQAAEVDVGKGLPRDVTIVSQEGDMLVEFSGMVLHCDNKGKKLQTFNPDGPLISFTRHMFKESLVPHPFLQMQQDGGNCDNKGKKLQTFNPDGPLISFTRHMFKESLVPHPFLQMQQDGGTDEPPFFKEL